MKYDPIKRDLGNVFNRHKQLRKIFYNLLDLLLLRAWHINSELRIWSKKHTAEAAILDAGSGFGQYVYSMLKLNPAYTIKAVDVKEEQVADCNEFFSAIGESKRVHFEVGDLTSWVKPASYDLILTVDVMEHIEEDRLVFKNFHQSMKPGGMLLISTPSDQGGSDAHHDHEHDHDHEDGIHGFIDEHVRDGYNISDIEEKLRTAGFTKVEARYAYGIPGKISWKLSMKYPIILLNTSRLFFLIIPIWYLINFPICLILNWFDLKMHHKTGTGLIVKAWK
jgi:SAM-dependent methyltransferase